MSTTHIECPGKCGTRIRVDGPCFVCGTPQMMKGGHEYLEQIKKELELCKETESLLRKSLFTLSKENDRLKAYVTKIRDVVYNEGFEP